MSYEPITLPDERTLKNKPPEAFGAAPGGPRRRATKFPVAVRGSPARLRSRTPPCRSRKLGRAPPRTPQSSIFDTNHMRMCRKIKEIAQYFRFEAGFAEFCVENLRIAALR